MKETNTHTITEVILKLEEEALERWENGDPDGYLELYAEDIVYFDPFFDEKLEGLDTMKAYYETIRGRIHADRYQIIQPVVQVSGTMAVLTYNLCSVSGEEVYRWNCTEVYRQGPSMKWKIIHSHWSFVKPGENR